MQIDNDDNVLDSQTNKTAAEAAQRGYCNWLIPNTVMIGRYPGNERTNIRRMSTSHTKYD